MPSKSREFAAYVPGLILRHFRRDPAPPTRAAGDRLSAVALFADVAGSTKITNELTRLGRLHGPEEMYRILNAYYEPLVSQLNARGGDVIGFAGDAVMALWPVGEGQPLRAAVRQATQAALEIQRDLNDMELAPGVRLSLRVCLGAGEVSTALVGGRQGFWQLVASGPPMDQIRAAGSVVQIGRVFLSKEACEQLGAGAEFEPHPDGGAFVSRIANPPPPPDPATLPDVTALPEESLRPFVQRAVQESIDAGMADYLDQSRTVSVLFVRLGRPPGVPASWERVQDAMSLVQDAAAKYEGTVAQFIEDDKGLICLMAFGLPMVGHEDDPRRAIEAAAFLQDPANSRGLRCAIGASTGLPFCGALGAPKRRVVYTVTGADVVRAARLMQLARDGEILCDEDTHAAARKATAHRFVALPRLALKGYDTPARVFRVVPAGAGRRSVGIGREREWGILLAVLDGAAAGRGGAVWLEGEEGSGASALVDEAAECAAGRMKRLGVPDRAAEAPGSPWEAVWTDLLGLRRVRDLVRRQERIEEFFETRPGPASLLNDLLGTSVAETAETRALAPADRVGVRNDLLFALVEELARERPVLLILENVHRLDAPSLALARRLAGLDRVALLATAEPTAAPNELRDNPTTLLVPLPPLDEPTLARLVRERLRANKLGKKFAALLRERAGGNPARAERECDRLITEDRLVIDHGVCELANEPVSPARAGASGRAAPLVGRTAERGTIGAALDTVGGGASRVVLIEGDTGSGKSRLVEEARRMAEDRVMPAVVGHCSAVEASTPYFPWRAVCDELLGLSEHAEAAERGARVLAALDRAPECRPFAPLLNDQLGLALPEDEVVRQMTGQNRADNLNAVLAGLIGAAADGRPTLILLEDTQWADSASWRLAKLVRERVERVAVVLTVNPTATALPAEHDLFATAEWADRITLDALSEDDTREFARAQFGAERVADPLARLVWRRTQGNPLFIEQIAEHLLEAGLVAVENGTAALRAGAANDVEPVVPDTIRGLVTARIDRLPPAHQLTAKVSSVIGTLFPTSALTAIYPDRGAVAAVPEHVGTLTRERLLRQECADPDAVYDFPHPVLQQVCYEMLTRPQRQKLHHSAAEWFQSDQGGSGPQFRLIAHHWGRAGVVDRQVDYLSRAGDAALRDGAFREAATGFAEVLRLSRERFPENPPAAEVARRAHWEFQLGEAIFGLGELPSAAEHYRAALALRGRVCRASKAGLVADSALQFFRQFARRLFRRRATTGAADAETREVAATYLRLGRISYFANDMLPGTNAILRALNLAETVRPSPELALAYGSATLLCCFLKWNRAARTYARLAESNARAAGNLQNQCLVLAYIAMYHLGQGDWEPAEALAREAIELAERLGDHQQQGDTATILAMLNCFRARYAEALKWCERVTESAKRSGNAMHLAWTANLVGECYFRLGRDAEAEAKLKESLEGLRGNKSRTEEVRIEGMLAALAVRAGNWAAAAERATAAEAVARAATATTCSTMEGFAGIAEARFAQAECEPQNAEARKAAKSALAALRKHAAVFPVSRPRTALYEGRLLLLAGAPAKAVRVWKDGLAQAAGLRMPFEEALLRDALARHLPPDSPERREHVTAALELYEKLGVAFEAKRLRGGVSDGR